jgi:hypothetical protein
LLKKLEWIGRRPGPDISPSHYRSRMRFGAGYCLLHHPPRWHTNPARPAVPGNHNDRPSSDAIVRCVKRVPITCQILDIVVDRMTEVGVGNEDLSVEDQVVPETAKLLEVCGNSFSTRFLAPPALLFVLVCLRGGSVFDLGHPAKKAFSRALRKLSIPWGCERGRTTVGRGCGRIALRAMCHFHLVTGVFRSLGHCPSIDHARLCAPH